MNSVNFWSNALENQTKQIVTGTICIIITALSMARKLLGMDNSFILGNILDKLALHCLQLCRSEPEMGWCVPGKGNGRQKANERKRMVNQLSGVLDRVYGVSVVVHSTQHTAIYILLWFWLRTVSWTMWKIDTCITHNFEVNLMMRLLAAAVRDGYVAAVAAGTVLPVQLRQKQNLKASLWSVQKFL